MHSYAWFYDPTTSIDEGANERVLVLFQRLVDNSTVEIHGRIEAAEPHLTNLVKFLIDNYHITDIRGGAINCKKLMAVPPSNPLTLAYLNEIDQQIVPVVIMRHIITNHFIVPTRQIGHKDEISRFIVKFSSLMRG